MKNDYVRSQRFASSSISWFSVISISAFLSVAFLVTLSFNRTASADDWSQWLGQLRNSEWNESGIISSIPEEGLEVKWRMPVAGGYSGPAVVGDRVFITDFLTDEGETNPDPGRRTELIGMERLLCFNAETGEEIWKYEYECEYAISYAFGPRATPTVNDGAVYMLGAEGRLSCVRVEDGEEIWSKDLKQEYNIPEAPIWGFAAHPLVHGDTIYALVGGEDSVAVAFDKTTGEEKWRALSAEESGYCPPTMINAGGTDQLLIWHPQSINSLNPETGEVYWSVDIEPAYAMSIVAPIFHDEHLLVTGLQGASMLLKLDSEKPAATEVWRGKGVHPDHNPPIVVDGHIYGIDVKGQLRCIDLIKGERIWESLATTPDGRPEASVTGFIVKNGEQYFIMNELGELILAKMSPEGYEEIGRQKLLEPTSSAFGRNVVWSHPAFSNKCMFARNDKEIICVSLAE